MIRVLSTIIFLLTLFADIWLYFKSQETTEIYLILFGLISAVFLPLAFSLFGYSFNKNNREIIKKLSKVPEIDRLVLEAKTAEEKVENLKQERQKLENIIQSESKRFALISKKENLEKDAKRILNELDVIEEEIRESSNRKIEGLTIDEVTKLKNELKRKNRVILFLKLEINSLFWKKKMYY